MAGTTGTSFCLSIKMLPAYFQAFPHYSESAKLPLFSLSLLGCEGCFLPFCFKRAGPANQPLMQALPSPPLFSSGGMLSMLKC